MATQRAVVLLCCAATAWGATVDGFLEGYVSGEVYSKETFSFGTMSVKVSVGGGCVGVDTGIGLLHRTDTEHHDISFFYSQQNATFTASVSTFSLALGNNSASWRQEAWAPFDPISDSVILSIEWTATNVLFKVNGVSADLYFPFTTGGLTGSEAAVYTAGSDAIYSAVHTMYLFTLPSERTAPSAACLPQTARFYEVAYTPVSSAQTSFSQTTWTTNAIATSWTSAAPDNMRSTEERSAFNTIIEGAESVGPDGDLQIAVANPLFTPLPAADDVDADLISTSYSEAVWNVTSDTQSTVRAERTTSADGKLALRVVSTGVAYQSSIAVDKTVAGIEAGAYYCSFGRVYCEQERNVSLSLIHNVHEHTPLLVPAHTWQLFNNCFVEEAATDSLHVYALLGRYDNSTIEFHSHSLFVDFIYTTSVSMDAAPIAFEGDELLGRWYVDARFTPRLQQLWVGSGSSWAVSVIDTEVVDNVVTNSGTVKMVASGAGEGVLSRKVVTLDVGITYKVTVTAHVISTTADKKFLFVRLKTSLRTHGGVNMFEVTGTSKTFEYIFRTDFPDATEQDAANLEITLFSENTPNYGGFATGDEVYVTNATMYKWSATTQPSPRFPVISPTIARRDDDTNQSLPWDSVPVYQGSGTIPAPPATPTPTTLTALEQAYAQRYGKYVVEFYIIGGSGVAEQYDIAQMRADLGDFLGNVLNIGSANEDNIKVLKVCTNDDPIEILNTTTNAVDEPIKPLNSVTTCTPIVGVPGTWYNHIELNGTIVVHFMVVNLPGTDNFFAVDEMTKFFERLALGSSTGTVVLGKTVVSSASYMHIYVPTYLDITPTPPVIIIEGDRRSDLKDGIWVIIIISAFIFCLLFGIALGHAMVKMRPDQSLTDSEDDSEDEMDHLKSTQYD